MATTEQALSRKDIPNAPYYVTCTDKFFSGWGKSENATCKRIFVCQSLDEATIVSNNLVKRKDDGICYINIVASKPFYKNAFNRIHTKENSRVWYKPDFK